MNRGAGIVLVLAVLAGIVWASHAPVPVHRPEDGVLRLAWSARPERIEECRQRTTQELAQLPQHMRQTLVCEGTTAEYQLQVRVDGALVAERLVRGGGLRRDRHLYVFDELPLRAGVDTVVEVRLDRVDSVDAAAARPPSASGRSDRVAPAPLTDFVPPRLSLERRLRFSPREVILVTYDRDRRALTLVRRDPPADGLVGER